MTETVFRALPPAPDSTTPETTVPNPPVADGPEANPLLRAITVMLREAEDLTGRIARTRRALETAELKRRKLVTALDSALQALPEGDRKDYAVRMTRLAEARAPRRGRRPDSRQQAVIEYLARRAHLAPGGAGGEVVKVSEVQTHLEHLGYKRLPHGYASAALARLAEQGMVIKTRFARYRINPVHPELVTLRFKLLDAEVGQLDRRQREIREAERRGRERR